MGDRLPPTEPTLGAFELKTVLDQVGLGRYEERLRENGFSDWHNVTAITENDMAEMGFRLGDRRKLQRIIREYNAARPPQVSSATWTFKPVRLWE